MVMRLNICPDDDDDASRWFFVVVLYTYFGALLGIRQIFDVHCHSTGTII